MKKNIMDKIRKSTGVGLVAIALVFAYQLLSETERYSYMTIPQIIAAVLAISVLLVTGITLITVKPGIRN